MRASVKTKFVSPASVVRLSQTNFVSDDWPRPVRPFSRARRRVPQKNVSRPPFSEAAAAVFSYS
jgi:hypothetical protein